MLTRACCCIFKLIFELPMLPNYILPQDLILPNVVLASALHLPAWYLFLSFQPSACVVKDIALVLVESGKLHACGFVYNQLPYPFVNLLHGVRWRLDRSQVLVKPFVRELCLCTTLGLSTVPFSVLIWPWHRVDMSCRRTSAFSSPNIWPFWWWRGGEYVPIDDGP